MAQKGLIVNMEPKGRPAQYMAAMFVVGIYEFQVNDLDAELVHDFEEYLPTLFDAEAWKKVPQLRTIPVGESVESRLEVMPYEQAEEIVRGQDKIAVAPCVCRREQKILGEGCSNPEESCMSFGMSADYYLRRGVGRAITQTEALDILRAADEAALVLQPANMQEPEFICTCCGCCCGVLRSVKRHPRPASLVSSPFFASLDAEQCEGCGVCIDRCQMEALAMGDDKPTVDLDRCIGCGLCVSKCPTEALKLVRKPEAEITAVPKNAEEQYISLSKVRGKVNTAGLVKMMVRSKVDRLLAS
jgi:Pyruvate/2-oxoacid:ferredoxin oxidoreductase delta subunit